MKLLIATRSDSNISDMTALTHPSMKAYASRIGADFVELNQSTPFPGDGKYHYRILALQWMLKVYDRILSLDSDVLVMPGCPNIFDVVPETHIGTVFEDVGSRQAHRRLLIGQVQREWGNVGWTTGYINTGCFVVSRAHSNIFQTNSGKVWSGFGYDDVHLGYNIRKFGHSIHELPFQWNHMTMFSEPWNDGADRFQSHIIHYAGNGIFDSGTSELDQIKYDLSVVYPSGVI